MASTRSESVDGAESARTAGSAGNAVASEHSPLLEQEEDGTMTHQAVYEDDADTPYMRSREDDGALDCAGSKNERRIAYLCFLVLGVGSELAQAGHTHRADIDIHATTMLYL